MKEKFAETVRVVSSLIAILSAIFTGIGWINHQYVDYLEKRFALRQDFERLKAKVDQLLIQGKNHEK